MAGHEFREQPNSNDRTKDEITLSEVERIRLMFDPEAAYRGELQCVGATTLNEYRKYIEKDAALERRFQTIKVEAPTVEEAVEILKGLRPKYEAHHKAKLTDEALEAAVRLSDRYITGRFLPDKAIDVMDEAGARARINSMTQPPDVKEIEKSLETIRAEKEAASKLKIMKKQRRCEIPNIIPTISWSES